MYWIGFDVGGTFVDLFGYQTETGKFFTLKVPSSRDRLPDAIKQGLDRLLHENGIAVEQVGRIVHGTTVVANQLVEGKGARVGVITTAGFRDVLEIGRMRRPSLYDLYMDKVPPLAPRQMRLEVDERVTAAGTVQVPLDESQGGRVIGQLADRGAEVLAICLLNSYANPVHEEALGELCRRSGMPFTLSAEVSSEYGEFERWTTAAVNSYVMPRTAGYLGDLGNVLGELGITRPVEVMQSNGGVISTDVGAALPVRLVESGPAAGVTGATISAQEAGYRNLITMDMGGTSTDISLVLEGKPTYTSEYSIDGYPVRALGIDIRSIGAGGGSLARLDRTRALLVGPESAGSEPGPACYERGGGEPTVTDADLVLGYLDPESFCGGEIPLSIEAARDAIGRVVASPLDRTVEEAALGIVAVATVNMVGAIRRIATERGCDPRDFTLVAFGGAGPVHAGVVALELNIPEVLIPNQPGLLSAKGLILSDYRADAYQTLIGRVDQLDVRSLEDALHQLEEASVAQLSGARDQTTEVVLTRFLEMSYEGQHYVIPIEVRPPIGRDRLKDAVGDLDRRFLQIHGFLPPTRVPQVLRIRVAAEGVVPRMKPRQEVPGIPPGEPHGWREVFFGGGTPKPHRTPVYRRGHILAETPLLGPCVIEEEYSTAIVYPGQTARIDGLGNILLGAAGSRA
jgi:N-methylhydantoinase A